MKFQNLSLKQVKHQLGFSLLETLVASTIFAGVLLIASSAFKFFMSAGERPVNSELVIKEAMSSMQVRESIKGLFHYFIKDNPVSSEPSRPFFLGTEDGFTGITINALDYSHQPTRIAVSLQDNAKSNTLNYCEYDNAAQFPRLNIKELCEKPRVIASNIKTAKFSYYGWKSLNHLYGIVAASNPITDSHFNEDRNWSQSWEGKKRGLLPTFIKIDITYEPGHPSYYPTQLWFEISDADPVQFSAHGTNND